MSTTCTLYAHNMHINIIAHVRITCNMFNCAYVVQGTHKSLKDNTKAKATVGAIIDGMGSLGKYVA